METYLRRKNFSLFFLVIFVFGCKKESDEIVSSANTKLNDLQQKLADSRPVVGNKRILITDPKIQLGLVQRIPEYKIDILAYGDKDNNGFLKNITQTIIYNPNTYGWIQTLYENGLPTYMETSKGYSIELKNYDVAGKSVIMNVKNIANGKEFPSVKINLSADFFQKVDAYKSGVGGRVSVADICNEESKRAILIAGISANIFSCSMGFITVGLALATEGLALAVIPEGISLLLGCIGTVQGINELINDSKGDRIEEFLGANGNCAYKGGGLGYGTALDCVKGTAKPGLGNIVTGIVQCSATLLGGGADLYGCGCKDGSNTTDPQTTSPSSTGGAFGDPHLQTFDGLYYDFQGYGEFIAVKSLTDNFEIQVRQEQIAPYLNRQVTMHTGIAVNTGNDKVCVYPDRLYINNKGYNIGDGFVALTKGSISTSNGLMTIVSDNEDVIKISTQSFSLGFIDYKVTLNSNRKNKVLGLLGNFDGTANNDTKLQTGSAVNSSTFGELYPAYANSWRINQDKSLFVYSSGTSTETYTKKDFPKSQTELDAAARLQAETICRQKGVTNEPYLSACIMDVGLSGSDRYAVSAVGAQESKLLINNFTINKFTSFEALDITPYGNAEIVDGLMYLTRNKDFQVAAIFKKYKVDITSGFETTFDFSMTDVGGWRDARNRTGADGIVFVIQDYGSKNVPLASGVGLGYDGLPRSLAVEFDTYNNGSYENQDDISLNTQGINPNSVDDSRTLIKAQTRQLPVMNDGKVHNVTIRYTKKSDGIYKMEVFFDKDASPYLTADNINIQKTIGAYGSGVYIGFTSATGYSWENHIIHNWSYKPL